MTDERGSSPLALAIREVPGIAIASIGFGCALLAIEGDRLSTIRTVNIAATTTPSRRSYRSFS